MTKKVLGSDPFTREGDDESKESEAPRPSKRPGAKSSKRPSARPSKRPSAKASAGEKQEITRAPKAAKVPAEALIDMDASSDAVAPLELTSDAASDPTAANAPIAASEPPEAPQAAPIKSSNADEDSAIDDVGAEASVSPATSEALANADAPAEASAPEPEGSIEDKIRALESQLDVLLARAGRERTPDPHDEVALVPDELPARSAQGGGTVREAQRAATDEETQDSTSDIATGEFYAKQWGRVALRDRAEDVDEFGLDEQFSATARPLIDALYTKWWRVETHGIENVPDAGRVILCANHAGAVPYDGLMLAAALRREHPARRPLRWLADDFVFHFPFMGVALNRLGAVRACQENAERLLRTSTVVGVFPEGVKGVSKSYRERYQLQRFGRGGHIKLALRTRTPIVPVAIVGSEETHPMLPTGPLAKLLNLPIVPVTPTFPWFGALGLVPLPAKWSISFLPPISVDGYDEKSADDELLVGRLNEKVRAAIQDELDARVRQRRSLFR